MRRALVRVARRLARAGFVRPFVRLIARDALWEAGPWRHSAPPRVTLLALTPQRFRGDLEILNNSGAVRIIELPEKWQRGLLALYWTPEMSREIDLKREYFSDDIPDWIKEIQRQYRKFLTALIPPLFRRLKIDAVISAAIWYQQDYDWGVISERLGTPYIVLQAENLATAPGQVRRLVYNASMIGKFSGSCIIVHNEVCRDAFIEAGFIEADKIQALGALRMDELLDRIADARRQGNSRGRKRVTLFSFHRGAGLWGLTEPWPTDRAQGLTQYFEAVHGAIGELALEFPDVDFVIKPKWGGSWIGEIERVLQANNVDRAARSNLEILPDANAHELILRSNIVCGYGSTTLLEAGIAGKKVIMPLFYETTRPEYQDFLHFRDELDMFVVPSSPDEFKDEIRKALASDEVDQRRLDLCCRAFERHISSLEGGTLDKYLSVISGTIDRRADATHR